MPLVRQLEFAFGRTSVAGGVDPGRLSVFLDAGVNAPGYSASALETIARQLLRSLGAV